MFASQTVRFANSPSAHLFPIANINLTRKTKLLKQNDRCLDYVTTTLVPIEIEEKHHRKNRLKIPTRRQKFEVGIGKVNHETIVEKMSNPV